MIKAQGSRLDAARRQALLPPRPSISNRQDIVDVSTFVCDCPRSTTQRFPPGCLWSADRVFATTLNRRAHSLHLGFQPVAASGCTHLAAFCGRMGGQTGTSSNLHNTDYAHGKTRRREGAFRAFFAATAFTPQHNNVPGSSVPNESWATPRTSASVAAPAMRVEETAPAMLRNRPMPRMGSDQHIRQRNATRNPTQHTQRVAGNGSVSSLASSELTPAPCGLGIPRGTSTLLAYSMTLVPSMYGIFLYVFAPLDA